MDRSELIYEKDGYIYINSKVSAREIINSNYIKENVIVLSEVMYELSDLNKTIEEIIYNIEAPIICVLFSLNAFIEIDHKDYERNIMAKNIIKDKKIDLKSGEKLNYIFFRKLKSNEAISIASTYKSIDNKMTRLSISTFLELTEEKKINQVYITSNLANDKPNRELTIELMMIERDLNEILIRKVCNTFNILSKHYRNEKNINYYDELDVSYLLSKSIESCYRHLYEV